jgi:hypothetical protein
MEFCLYQISWIFVAGGVGVREKGLKMLFVPEGYLNLALHYIVTCKRQVQALAKGLELSFKDSLDEGLPQLEGKVLHQTTLHHTKPCSKFKWSRLTDGTIDSGCASPCSASCPCSHSTATSCARALKD